MGPTNKRVLLVDDDPAVLHALRLVLETLQFIVIPCNGPVDAIRVLKEGLQVDIILCDLKMPIMSGLEVLPQAGSLSPSTAFYLMSAHATSLEVNKAKDLGAKGFLPKPFTPDELIQTVIGTPEEQIPKVA